MARRSQIDVLNSDALESLTKSTELRLDEIEANEIAELIKFFKLLDQWDREANPNAKVM